MLKISFELQVILFLEIVPATLHYRGSAQFLVLTVCSLGRAVDTCVISGLGEPVLYPPRPQHYHETSRGLCNAADSDCVYMTAFVTKPAICSVFCVQFIFAVSP